jgi:mannose-1-phosphate guanylyltransferase/phosphomannomutase
MKAMVLCAGLGTRMGELTRAVPKPLLPVAGHPLLAYVLGHLQRQGITQLILNLHFRPDLIRDHFGDGARWGLELAYSEEPVLLGTAGGVKQVEASFREEPEFLVHYGDILTDQDFVVLQRFHRDRRALATLLVHPRPRSNSVVKLDGDGRIVGFLERPAEAEREGIESPWVNSGVYVLSPEILEQVPPHTPCDWPRDIFTKLVHSGRLFGLPLTGYRCAVDSPARLAEARDAVATGRCRIEPLR